MSKGSNKDDNTFRPGSNLDDALQREIDEALGGMSLEEMIQSEEARNQPAGLAKGVRRGTVVNISKDDIFVDLGGKSQGILSSQQFEDQPLPAVGDSVEVTIEGYDQAEGLLILSRQGAIMQAAWATLEEGQILEGRCTGFNKGGLEMNINGIAAFMPISQIEMARLEDLSPYVNTRIRCQVIEVDPEARKVVVSRRALLEVEEAQARQDMMNTLCEGKTVKGTVRSIMPYGAFVTIGHGVDGLLHVKDMSHSRVDDPNKVVKVGQPLELMVLKVDKEAGRISLGLKQALPDPWSGADQRFPANDVVSGRVTRLADFGAFVELEPGVEGLIPMGEMSFVKRVNSAGELLSAGQVIKVRVMSVDLERKRISLSLKRVGDDPWVGASVRWPVESAVTGIVKRIAEFGAFVELTPGVEGLVHISALSDKHVRNVGEAVQVGQTVQAKVLDVDEENRRISLSIKALLASADYTGPAAATDPAAEPAKPPKKRKTPLKGGLD